MPPEAAEEYQSILTASGRRSRHSGEVDEGASEALRKLDGIRPTTPRSSRDSGSTKSPRHSRQLSEGKASGQGRRTPGGTSRTVSPAGKGRESSRPESLKATPRTARPGDAQKTAAVPSPQARKSSVNTQLDRYSMQGSVSSPVSSARRISANGVGPREVPPSSAARAQRVSKQAESATPSQSTNGHSSGQYFDDHRKLVPPVPPLPRALDKTSPITSPTNSKHVSPASPYVPLFQTSSAEEMEHLNNEYDIPSGKSIVGRELAATTKQDSPARGSFSLARKFSFSSISNALQRSPSSREKSSKASPESDPRGIRRLSAVPLRDATAEPGALGGVSPLSPSDTNVTGLHASPRTHKDRSPSGYMQSSTSLMSDTSRGSISSTERVDKEESGSDRTSRPRSILGLGGLLRSNSRRASGYADNVAADSSGEGKGLLSRISLSRNSATPSYLTRKRTTVSKAASCRN
jgi:hypothetical protein